MEAGFRLGWHVAHASRIESWTAPAEAKAIVLVVRDLDAATLALRALHTDGDACRPVIALLESASPTGTEDLIPTLYAQCELHALGAGDVVPNFTTQAAFEVAVSMSLARLSSVRESTRCSQPETAAELEGSLFISEARRGRRAPPSGGGGAGCAGLLCSLRCWVRAPSGRAFAS